MTCPMLHHVSTEQFGYLDVLTLAKFKATMATLGIKARAFAGLLKAGQPKNKPGEGEEKTEVFDDNTPVLSPSLGFGSGLALVAVSLRE